MFHSRTSESNFQFRNYLNGYTDSLNLPSFETSISIQCSKEKLDKFNDRQILREIPTRITRQEQRNLLDRSLHPQNKCESSNCRQFETKQPATAERFRDPISGLAGCCSHCSAATGSSSLRRVETNLVGSVVPSRRISDYRGRGSIAGTGAVKKSLASSITTTLSSLPRDNASAYHPAEVVAHN